jgi:hypothetical protein
MYYMRHLSNIDLTQLEIKQQLTMVAVAQLKKVLFVDNKPIYLQKKGNKINTFRK